MSRLVPFTFENVPVRVVERDGELWFVAVDVANILEYSDAYEMTKKLDQDEKSNRQIAGLGSPSGGRGVTLINESGLYSCILTSQKASAKRFKKWVTAEVLPAIRKTGGYDTGEARRDATVAYKMMCETLQGNRAASGKDTKAHHYINEARMINAALTGAFQGIDRARLRKPDLDLLIRLEHENDFLLRQEKPYAERKTLLSSYADTYRKRLEAKAAKRHAALSLCQM